MARPPRDIVAGVAYHVVQRGNNRMPVFSEFQDYHLYLRFLAMAADKTGCAIHAYVLMTNHIHLLVTPETSDGISILVQYLGRSYVRYYNDRHERSGTLWEGRFKAGAVTTDSYLLNCMRYIETNPVRAGMCSRPGDYRWSSHLANCGRRDEALVQPHPAYLEISTDPFKRMALYEATFAEDVDAAVVAALRHGIR